MTDNLDNLQSQIRDAQKTNPDFQNRNAKPTDDSEATGMGIRAITDLIATPIIAGGAGMGLDHWFGTKPWLFIIMAFLGICAGFYNLFKASQGLSSKVGAKRDN